jgi:hypothetical protein
MASNSVQRVPECLEADAVMRADAVESERRKRTRLQVHWPLSFIRPGVDGAVATVTEDLSSDGFYCFASIAFVPGEIRECTLGVPMHRVEGHRTMPVWCRVRVVRVEALPEAGRYGVGCRIEDYRFLNPSKSGGAADRVLQMPEKRSPRRGFNGSSTP